MLRIGSNTHFPLGTDTSGRAVFCLCDRALSDEPPLSWAAVTVVSDQDQGCQGVPADHCEREIDVTSAARLSPEQTAQIVTTALIRLHGWRLGPYQAGCRREGWLTTAVSRGA
jgi:hypothetical protein